MFSRIKKFFSRKYHHLNTVSVFFSHLVHNYQKLSGFVSDAHVVPVLKSNAYGHGLRIIAPRISELGCDFVCVDSLHEAYELRKYRYLGNILVMGYVDPLDIPNDRCISYAVSDIVTLSHMVQRRPNIRLHIFIDSGIHREGITPSVFLAHLIDFIPYKSNIVGIMSHLSTGSDVSVSDEQIQSFLTVLQRMDGFFSLKYAHICASDGIIHAHQYQYYRDFSLYCKEKNITHVVRAGLSFYGYGHPELLPALCMTSTVAEIKTIPAGSHIGYNRTYRATRDMRIATLPIGYNDGLDRRLSNMGRVLIRGQICQIVGLVSMNISTVDITDFPDISMGDEVVIFDEKSTSLASLESQSATANMIPYDTLVHIHSCMYRVIV